MKLIFILLCTLALASFGDTTGEPGSNGGRDNNANQSPQQRCQQQGPDHRWMCRGSGKSRECKCRKIRVSSLETEMAITSNDSNNFQWGIISSAAFVTLVGLGCVIRYYSSKNDCQSSLGGVYANMPESMDAEIEEV